MTTTSVKSTLLISFSLLLLFFIGYVSYLYPWCQDDYTYRFIFLQNNLVNSITDIIESQIIHWHEWGGRFVAHSLVQFFLMFDKIWFSIANTAIYALCCMFIVKYSPKEKILTHGLICLTSLWLMMPSCNGTIFWLTGSFNYLWPSAFTTIFLYLITSRNKKFEIIAILLAPVAGNFHESISAGVTVTLTAYAILSRYKSINYYIALSFYIMGFLSNALAPGNFSRLSAVTNPEYSDFISFLYKYFTYSLKVIYRLTLNWSDMRVQLCSLSLITAVIICYKNYKKTKQFLILPICLILGAICSLSINIVSGTAYVRSVYGFCYLAYLALMLSLFSCIKTKCSNIILGVLLTLNCIFIPICLDNVSTIKNVMKRAEECCKNKLTYVLVDDKYIDMKHSFFASHGMAFCSLDNPSMEKYFNTSDISTLYYPHYQVLKKNQTKLINSPYNKVLRLDNTLCISKLKTRPISISSEIIEKKQIGDSLFDKVQHYIASHKKQKKSCFLVKLYDSYYIYWTHINLSATLKFNDDKTITLVYKEQ